MRKTKHETLWRLAVFINEGLGSYILSVMLFAFAGRCFHEAFAPYYAQGEEARRILAQEQEPFRGEKYPILAALLTGNAAKLHCDEKWHTDFKSSHAAFLAIRAKHRLTPILPSPSIRLLRWPFSKTAPKLVRCGSRKDDSCQEGRPPAGWRDADPIVSSFSPDFPKTDFRAPSFLDEIAATADAAMTLPLESIEIPKGITSLYFITARGSIRIAPRGRLHGSRSHRFYGSASYFQDLVNESPHACGDTSATKTLPYLDFAGGGIIETFCKTIPQEPENGTIDGILCADIPIPSTGQNTTLLDINEVQAEIGGRPGSPPRITGGGSLPEDIKSDLRQRLSAGASGTGGLGGIERVGSGFFAAVVQQHIPEDRSRIIYNISVVRPKENDAISVSSLAFGLILLFIGGAITVHSMIMTRQRHQNEELRGMPHGIIIESLDGHIEFGNAHAESLLGVELPARTQGRLVRLLLAWAGRPISDRRQCLESFVKNEDRKTVIEHRARRAKWETTAYEVTLVNETRVLIKGSPIRRSRARISSFGTIERVNKWGATAHEVTLVNGKRVLIKGSQNRRSRDESPRSKQ